MPRIAFFDVDETLITLKSMFSFLDFRVEAQARYEHPASVLAELAAAGVSREETNRLYYANFAGERVADIARSGRRWFSRVQAGGTLFHPDVVREFGSYQAEGAVTALVSGSFSACLDPIAEYLGASHILGSEPESAAGRYTGKLRRTVIGAGKASAANALMAELGARAQDCVAYGDHASDLPLLLAVGDAVVVGDDPVLTEQAPRYGWSRLPAKSYRASEEVRT